MQDIVPLLERFAASLLLALTLSCPAFAQQPQPAVPELPLFAVEITIGSKWDSARTPQDQRYFREHSANLKRLRDAGHLIMGARYSDKGLVILAAENETAARAMMDEDLSMKAGTFKYEVHPFSVFYGGTLSRR